MSHAHTKGLDGWIYIPSFHHRYPHCLHFLDLLQSEYFRRELANSQCSTFIENQQILHWHFYTKKRMQFQEKLCECDISVKPVEGISEMAIPHLRVTQTSECARVGMATTQYGHTGMVVRREFALNLQSKFPPIVYTCTAFVGQPTGKSLYHF